MTQVIIFSNDNGGVSVCIPTGELPINEVLAKDCPAGAIIVEDATLPQGSDAQFFDAWELNEGVVTVNFAKAQAIALKVFNAKSLQEAQARQLNTLAGIANDVDDATWSSALTAGRDKIANATTTAELV